MVPGRTCYAKSGDVHVAYRAVGDGPLDVVFMPGWISHCEVCWEEPRYAHFLSRLASLGRLLFIDKRGVGLSDPVVGAPTIEDRMEDIRAVMDHAESERAVLLGISEGGPMNIVFAAAHPERTRSLILYGTFARGVHADDYPWMPTNDVYERAYAVYDRDWGTGRSLRSLAPELADDPPSREFWARYERQSASPAMAIAVQQLARRIDVRDLLAAVRVPTLVLHRTGDRRVPVENGRVLAAAVPGARFVELDGDAHLFWAGDADTMLDEIDTFVTGTRRRAPVDRVLATILVTDIVESTRHAVNLGDRRWRSVLERHDVLAGTCVRGHRGRVAKQTGDGLLAVFDGPGRGIACALDLVDQVAGLGVEIRAGLHTGEIEVRDEDVAGIAVHVAARIGALAAASEVLVSSTVCDLAAGSRFEFVDRGTHDLKGVDGPRHLFGARDVPAPSSANPTC